MTEPTQTWRLDVAPGDVDEGLRSLWREVARSAPGVARALMSNLIVYGQTADRSPLGDEIDELSRQHPSRILRIEHDPSRSDASLTTTVLIHAIGRGTGRIGIEEIVMQVGGNTAGLASLVRRGVLGDLPTALWWTAPGLPQQSIVRELMAVGRQLVYDSSDWQDSAHIARDAMVLRSNAHTVELADLAWRRIQPFQRALAHATDLSSCRGRLGPLCGLTFLAPPADRSSVRLTIGWLIAQLDWRPVERRREGAVDEVVYCETKDGTIEIATRTAAEEDALTLTVTSEADREHPAIRIDRTAGEIAVAYSIDAPPFSVGAHPRTRANLVVAELQDLNMDGRFLTALDGLARLETL